MISLLLLAATAVTAFDEEIIVTADFRDTPEQQLTSSVSVVRPEDRGDVVNHLEEVLNQVPNVHFSSGASRGRFFQIRGIGERGQFEEPVNSSVGVIIDGVDMSGIGAAATLFDVQQVEVLRGPQGTLYGANALAGLIQLVTPEPTEEMYTRIQLDGGEYDSFGAGVVVSGPLSDSTGYRLSYRQYRDDGFMDNDFLNRDDTNNHDEMTLRGKLVWQGEQDRLQLSFGHIDVENGYDAFSLDNDRTTFSDMPGEDSQKTDYVSLKFDRSGERADFTASGAFANSDITYGYDEDWTHPGFHPFEYASTDLYERERDTRTVELRWLSNPEGKIFGGEWDWVFGFFGLRQNVDFDRTYTFAAGPFASDFQIERTALYGELGRDFGEDWRLSIGGRVERHGAEYDDSNGLDFDPDDDLFGARIVLEKTTSNGNLLYGSVSQGYKTGGFNQDGTLPAELREFDTEELWNVEFGYKAKLVDDRLTVRGAIFYMERREVQIQTSDIVPVPGNPAGEFVQFKSNSAEGFNRGVELELDFVANEYLTLFANVGWLDTEYDDFINANGIVIDGREQAHAPGYQFFVGGEFDFGNGWSARLEVEGKDDFYFSDSHDTQSDAYELINASVGYRGDSWQVRLWGRNLTDEDYFVRGFFFGNDPRDIYTARPFTQLGEPSRVGITASIEL